MKPNNETIRISERPGDDHRVYEVLREWGYGEKVIQRLLAEETTLDHNSQKAEEDLLHPIISTADVRRIPTTSDRPFDLKNHQPYIT